MTGTARTRTTTKPIARFKVRSPNLHDSGRRPNDPMPAPAMGLAWENPGMPNEADTVALLARYRQTLLEMHAARVESGGAPRRWNRLVNRLQRLHLELREEPRGRAGITGLINDEVPTVRQWAATHALFWDEALARAELERLAAAGPSLSEFGAKITLREYDAGRLDTTWTPK